MLDGNLDIFVIIPVILGHELGPADLSELGLGRISVARLAHSPQHTADDQPTDQGSHDVSAAAPVMPMPVMPMMASIC